MSPERFDALGGRKKIAVLDTRGALEEQVRDVAEERLSASAGDLRGAKGFISKVWKHNLFREYYRQREIATAKGEIARSGNLYVGEGADRSSHDRAMGSVIERFVQDYDEAIHTEAGEERRELDTNTPEGATLNEAVRGLVRDFASGAIDEDVFSAERDRLLGDMLGLTPEQRQISVNHTDNMLEVARQAKLAFEHGESLDQIDQEIEFVVGKARVGVRTESKYNTVDRIAEKLQSTKLGQLVNETTISAGVAIAYCLTAGLARRVAQSKILAWGTFGASALVSGAIAGARESVKVADERRQHSRERAKGKELTPEMSRRVEMERSIYKTVPAGELAETIDSLVESRNIRDLNDFLGAANVLAEAESRISLSDREKIDLLAYSNFESIEQERLRLDVSRAEAKIRLRNLVQSGAVSLPNGQDFDGFYSSVVDTQVANLRSGREGMEEKDRIFHKMRRKKVAGAVLKGAVTGVVIGGTAQELGAFFLDGKEGFVEHALGFGHGHQPQSVTALDGLRRWFEGEHLPGRVLNETVLPDGSKVSLPSGVELTVNPQTPGEYIFTKDGEVLSDHIKFEDGKLTAASEEILKQQEVVVGQAVHHLEKTTETTVGAKPFAQEHPDLFHSIHRKFWYDNNTAIFDKNELKLHWGGQSGTGLDAQGNYVFNVAKMTPDGSHFKDLSINAQEAIKNGQLKMLLSLSRDSQMSVVEIPINSNGQAVIDPHSEIGKMFFQNTGGHATFLGKFAEVGHSAGLAKDGAEQFEILATHVGKGVETVASTVKTVVDEPLTTFNVTDTAPFVEPPILVPVFGRRPMEKMANPVRRPRGIGYNYYGYGEFGDNRSWQENFSPRLRENPDAVLNPQEEIDWYFQAQQTRYPDYIEGELAPLESQNPEPMGRNVEGVVCLAVAGHQEHQNIFRTLETYRVQQDKQGRSIWNGNNSKFEIIVYVNWPQGSDPHLTMDEINRFKSSHPEVPVRVYTEEITNGRVEVGWYKKKAFDLALKRSQERGLGRDIILIANDADMVFSSPLYLESVREAMNLPNNARLDAIVGRYDLDSSIYERYPAFHVVMRFWQFMESVMRKNYGFVGTQGRNTIMRGSSYAAVGGNRTRDFWADVEFGQLFSEARGRNTVAYLNKSWVMVDPRREIDKFLSGEKVAYTWSDFNTRNVRGARSQFEGTSELSIDDLASLPESDERVASFRNRIADEIQEIINLFAQITPGYMNTPEMTEQHMADVKVLASRAASLLGIDADISRSDEGINISIRGTERLRQNLKKYKDLNRKEVKLNSRNNRNPLL